MHAPSTRFLYQLLPSIRRKRRRARTKRALRQPVQRREAHAMMRCWPELFQRQQMLLAAVAAIGFPAVARPGLGQPRHVAIARDLGEDRGGGDRIGPRLAADDGLGSATAAP